MMKKITFLLILFGVFLTTYGQTPDNDLCSGAIDLGLETSPLSSTTVGATDDHIAECEVNSNRADIYYSILVPSGSTLTIGQTVNGYDSIVNVFYGDCDNRTTIYCFDDSDIQNVVWANETGLDQTVYWVQDGYGTSSTGGTFTLAWSVIACSNATATYAVVSNCDIAEEFFVDIDVTDLGSATSLTVSDDQGSATQNVSSTGVLQFGPYPNGTPVIYTIANDQDNSCTITSATQTQAVCPPDCTTATVITACEEVITADFIDGPGAWNVNACGFSTPGVENVYRFTPTVDGVFSLEVISGNGWVDYYYKEASGSCDASGWTCINDVFATGTNPIGTLTAGTEYLILLDSEGTTARTHTFKILCPPTCTDATVTYAIVSNCDVAEEFFVDVDITDLGTATSITVSDDQGSATQNVTTTGVIQFGPYPNTTPVIFTIANDQDATCVLTSSAQTQAVCPPDCSQATVITACDEVVTADIPAGPGSWNVNTCGFNTPGIEIVYSFTPTTDGVYSLEVVTASGGYVDYYYKEASGTCDSTGWTCIDDNFGAGIDPIGTLTAGVEYLFLVDSEGTSARNHTFKINCSPTCTDATVTYTVVSNCDIAEEFFVDVDITDLGTATSITVSDDQGSATQNVTTTGVIQFGPYPNATPVIFTVANDQDATCVLTSSAQSQAVCPPDCTQATVIECDTDVIADIIDGNGSWNVNSCGFSTPGIEMVYSFTAPNDGDYTLEVTAATGGYLDYYYKEASGTCDNTGWTCIDDNFATGTDPIGTLVAGTQYLFLVDSEGTSARSQTFKIVCPVLATDTFDNANFTYRPNPVVDVLNLQYNKAITSVSVYNIVGQEVIAKTLNTNLSQVDMSALPSGTYMVKVTSNNEVKTIKVVKE